MGTSTDRKSDADERREHPEDTDIESVSAPLSEPRPRSEQPDRFQ